MTYLPEPYPTLAAFIAKIKEWGFTEQAGVGLTRRNDARKFSASKPYHGVIKLPCRGDLGRCAQTHINTVCMILRVKPKEFWAGPQAEDTPVLPRVAPKAPKAAAPRKVKLGQSITATVLSTISQSAGPLGFADIAKLCTERGYPVDPKQVSTACAVLAQGGHISGSAAACTAHPRRQPCRQIGSTSTLFRPPHLTPHPRMDPRLSPRQ